MRQIPNFLSAVRLLLTPLVVWLIHRELLFAAAGWLITAAITDVLDGWVARRLGYTSQTGAYLDPVADKVLLVRTFAALGIKGVTPLWFVWLVLGRDALILLFSAYAMSFRGIRRLPPTIWGKISTILQSLYICWAVLRAAGVLPGPPVEAALLWAATAGTLWSWADYTQVGLRLLRRED